MFKHATCTTQSSFIKLKSINSNRYKLYNIVLNNMVYLMKLYSRNPHKMITHGNIRTPGWLIYWISKTRSIKHVILLLVWTRVKSCARLNQLPYTVRHHILPHFNIMFSLPYIHVTHSVFLINNSDKNILILFYLIYAQTIVTIVLRCIRTCVYIYIT